VSILSVRGLGKSFGGVRALDGVDFELESGELLAMIGPNGAGKTTCFNIVNGQLRADEGSVSIAGQEVAGRAPHDICRLGVGRTFQITATFASMTVRENVQVALLAHHRQLYRAWRAVRGHHRAEADAVLRAVGMVEQAERPCAVLAYGDLKRLELAVALAGAPRLLLMDEPTAGMAPGERTALMALAASLARERNIGVLFTEHDMDVVFEHADRVLVLDRGKVIALGSPPQVRASAEVRRVYLGGGPPGGAHPC
jgi:branched-chain amino acid transport system ATP-binding protein